MASSGGIDYQTYDPSVQEAQLSASRTQFMDEVTVEAYESALNANMLARMNLDQLNEGLTLFQDFMSEQQKGLDIENTGSERFVNEVFPDFVATTQAGAGAVTSGLLSYIDETMGASSKYKGVSSTYGGQY